MKSLVRFFLNQHLFGNMLTAMIFLVGIYTVFTIRKDLFPKVEFDTTLVVAVLPGASPEQVEKLLVNPIEQAVREVDGIKKVISNATEGRAVITVQLDPDARDPDKTNTDLQRAVDRIENYPEAADRPVLNVIESGQTPVVELTIASDVLSDLKVRDIAKYLSDEISFVPGVAAVRKNVWQKKEILVSVSEDMMVRHDVSINQIINALKVQNVQLPGGDLKLPTGREKAVKTDGELLRPEDIMSTVIRYNPSGYGVRVGDVAEVTEHLEKPTQLYRTNGEASFSVVIIKKEKADALRVVDAVKVRMDELKTRLPKEVDFRFVNKFTEYLENRIAVLGSNMVIGVFLVLVVLALFLPFRVALVVSLGIPFSMLLGIITIAWLGMSLNLISLIGLIIVSGMLVDDAIVVVENVYRRLEGGQELQEAIVDGTTEMIAPVFASVLTTVAAFSPMLFMSGIFGKFIFQIPVMVILPLLYSLFEAFVIAPGHVFTIVGASVKQEVQNKKQDSEHWYEGARRKYVGFIEWTLNRKWLTMLGFVLLLVVSGGIAGMTKFILFPPDGIYTFFIRIDGEPGASLDEMREMVKKIEPYVAKLPKEELRDYVSHIGLQQNDPNDPLTKRASHYAQIRVNLTPESDRDRGVGEIVDQLRKEVPAPSGALKMGFEIAKGGPPQGRPISVNMYGEDFKVLRELGAKVKKAMAEVEGVQDIEDSEVIGKKEIRIVPDPKATAMVGLTLQEVAQTVRAAFAGVVATSSRTLDEEIDIRVQLRERREDSTRQLHDIRIGNNRGHLIPLDRIARFEETDSQLLIKHEKYKRIINVSANVDLQKTTAIAATKVLEGKLADLTKDMPDYRIEFGGENEDTQESMGSLFRAFGVAAMLIFMILVITFKSFVQPILVLFSIPLGFIGVVWALMLHGKPLSFMAMLGMIALAGVIVNNAIVFVDFFNQRRREGMAARDAILDASSTRLRPIIMTSVTTVLGLMPTAYGIGGSDGFVQTLALSLGWGLAIGSVLTAILFPALLLIVEGVQIASDRFFQRMGLGWLIRILKGH